MVVSVFVSCIALGSLAVSALARIGRTVLVVVLWLLCAWFTALYLVIETGPYWCTCCARCSATATRFPVVLHRRVRGLSLAIGPAIALSGAVLPLLFHALRPRGRRPRRAGGSPLQPEYAGSLAAR